MIKSRAKDSGVLAQNTAKDCFQQKTIRLLCIPHNSIAFEPWFEQYPYKGSNMGFAGDFRWFTEFVAINQNFNAIIARVIQQQPRSICAI